MKIAIDNNTESIVNLLTKEDTFPRYKSLQQPVASSSPATKDLKKLLYPKVIDHKSVIANFLTEVYSNIFKRSNRKFNNYIFQQIVKLPMVVSDKLYNYLNNYERTPITISRFTLGLYNLIYNDFASKTKIAFKLFDFDNDNDININDVLLILRSFHLIENTDKNLNLLEKIVNNFFNRTTIYSFDEFVEKTKKYNSDICILFLVFINNYLCLYHVNELNLYKRLINYQEKKNKNNSYKFLQKIKIDLDNLKLSPIFYEYLNSIKLTENYQYKPDDPIELDSDTDDDNDLIELDNFERDKIETFQRQQEISMMLQDNSISKSFYNHDNNFKRFKFIKEKTLVNKHEGIKSFLTKNTGKSDINNNEINNLNDVTVKEEEEIEGNINVIDWSNNNNGNEFINNKKQYLVVSKFNSKIESYKDNNTSSFLSYSGNQVKNISKNPSQVGHFTLGSNINNININTINSMNNENFHKRNKSIPRNFGNNILSVNQAIYGNSNNNKIGNNLNHINSFNKNNNKELYFNFNNNCSDFGRPPTFNTKNQSNTASNQKDLYVRFPTSCNKNNNLLSSANKDTNNLSDDFHEYENKLNLFKSKDELQTKTKVKLILVNSYIFYLKQSKESSFTFKKIIPIYELFPQKIKINKFRYQLILQSTIHNYLYNYTFIGEDIKEIDKFINKIKERNDINDISNDFDFGQQLGQGKFGHVLLGKSLHDNSDKKYAIKIVKKENKTDEEFKINRWESYIFSMLKNINHPNIVKCYKKYENSNNIFFVYEYIDGYDLKTFVKINFDSYNKINLMNIIEQLIKGLCALYKYCIIHRDIKTTNIMISREGIIKIIDFGLSRVLSVNELSTDPYGSLCFKAPELVTHRPYGFKVDVWAMGVTIYFLVFQALPFDQGDKAIIKHKIINDKININLPTCNCDFDSWYVLNLIQDCLVKSDDLRLDICSIYNKYSYKFKN